MTKVALVPTMIHALVHHPDVAQFNLRALRKISYGGSPMSEALLSRALEGLPHTRFYQIYGQTEAGPSVSVLMPKYHVYAGEFSGRWRRPGSRCPESTSPFATK